MLSTSSGKCSGDGRMHGTATRPGALGWDDYDAGVEAVAPYLDSSGTGQIDAIFPVTPPA